MPDFSQYRIGEREGGVVLECPECPAWHSGFIGGDSIAKLASRAATHNAEKHSSIDLGGYAAPVTFTKGDDGKPQPQWPTP